MCCEGRETATIREDCAKAPAYHKLRNASCAVKVLGCALQCVRPGALLWPRSCALECVRRWRAEGRQLCCEGARLCAKVCEGPPPFERIVRYNV